MKEKVLSVRQPWAWALLHGKPVENRTWAPSYRGRLLIHASQRFDKDGYLWIQENLDRLSLDAPLPERKEFQYGGIIGGVNLIDVVEYHDSPFFFGPKGLVCENPFELSFFELPAQLMIFNVELPKSY